MRNFFFLWKYEILNLLRARWLLPYAIILGCLSATLLHLAPDAKKAVLSLQIVAILILPMVSVLYASIYWYNSKSFTSLLMTQAVKRSSLLFARWSALTTALSLSFVVSVGVVFLSAGLFGLEVWALLTIGVTLTMIFTGLGILVSIRVSDPMKGIGISFLLWLYSALLHDGISFFVLSAFSHYPVEVPGILLLVTNPIDLGRLALLLLLDHAALMGYTGRILQKVFAWPGGLFLSCGMLLIWILAPLRLGLSAFQRKDL